MILSLICYISREFVWGSSSWTTLFYEHCFFMSASTPVIIGLTCCSVKEYLRFLHRKIWVNIAQAFFFGWLWFMNKFMRILYPPNFIPAWVAEFDLGTLLQMAVGKLLKLELFFWEWIVVGFGLNCIFSFPSTSFMSYICALLGKISIKPCDISVWCS